MNLLKESLKTGVSIVSFAIVSVFVIIFILVYYLGLGGILAYDWLRYNMPKTAIQWASAFIAGVTVFVLFLLIIASKDVGDVALAIVIATGFYFCLIAIAKFLFWAGKKL